MSIMSWFRRRSRGQLSRVEEAVQRGCWKCRSTKPLVWQRDLRIGHLYTCPQCDAVWHVWDDWPNTGQVEPGDIPLIEAWNAEPVTLEPEMRTTLRRIGASATHPTPANNETPCAVTTRSGEHFDCAIVREQDYAPYGGAKKNWRLANEIAKLEPSAFALPLEVREGTGNAPDVYKNVYYAEFVMPDGRCFSCQGLEVFLVHPDYRATDAKMWPRDDWGKAQSAGPILRPDNVAYFIADPFQPLWHSGS